MKKTIETQVTIEEMKNYIKENGWCHLVRELNYDGNSTEEAIEYVYDQHTLTKEEFVEKYFA